MAFIKVNTQGEWDGLAKSTTESTVGLIADGNKTAYEGVFVEKPLNSPAEGDIVFVDGELKPHLIAFGTYHSSSKPADWVAVGVVDFIMGLPHIVWKSNTTRKYADVYRYEIKDYKLDGAAHESTVVLHNKAIGTMTYDATSVDAFYSQVKEFVEANSPAGYTYSVHMIDGKVILQLDNYTEYQSTHSMSGLTLEPATAAENEACSNAYKKNLYGSEGGIINLGKALEYYGNSTASAEYQGDVKSDMHSLKRAYPINKASYLGHASDGQDHCAYVRSIFGEGEDGWRRYMEESAMLIAPNSRGALAPKYGDGKKNTYNLAYQDFVAKDGHTGPVYPAARYAAEAGIEGCPGVQPGDFFICSSAEGTDFMSRRTYGLSGIGASNCDRLTQSLIAIGGSPVRPTSNTWLSSRFNSNNEWYYNGNYGFMNVNLFYGAYYVVPVALYPWTKSNIE